MPARNFNQFRDTTASARRTGHPLSIVNALARASVGPVLLYDPAQASAFAEPSLMTARELGFPLYVGIGTVVVGWAIAISGKPEQGVMQIQEGISLYRSTGAAACLPLFFALLAEAMLARGDIAGAVCTSYEACRWGDENSEAGWDCRVHCTRGDAMLASGELALAEASYHSALAWSRQRSARWGELCSVLRLARLWRSDHRAGAARELLAPIGDWFTHDADTSVLSEAKSLLEELSRSRAPLAG